MKIAIHNSESGFSPRWVKYCQDHGIEYKIVNAYDSNIIKQVQDCDAFMWHHNHVDYRDALFAKQLIFALQEKGLRVFPDYNTTWHFDDKIAQKYILEAVDAPLVPSYVFYTKEEALSWAKDIEYPMVAKLRGGAGASNVCLIKGKHEMNSYVKKAFGKGFSQFNRIGYLKDKFISWKHNRIGIVRLLKSLCLAFMPSEHVFARMHPREKGYVLFQNFIPNNQYDIRICVVDGKAFALKRLCREGDFRASGSGRIIYDKDQIDERCVSIAFETNKKLKTQSIAFDFVFDQSNNPLIVEISYGYAVAAYDKCEGHWTEDMVWHPGTNFDFCGWMVEEIIRNKE